LQYSEIKEGEIVLEIGPGIGNITEMILESRCNLVIIEKNSKFIPALKDRFKHNKNLEIIHGDALKNRLPKGDRIVSNLPYSITEAFFHKMLKMCFHSATFIVSKGFSDIITALPENETYSKLSWITDLFYTVKVHETIPNSSYFPKPKVSTSMISIFPKYGTQSQKILKTTLKQSDRLTKNALRESLIQSLICETKNQAREVVDKLCLDQKTLLKRVSRLSLTELRTLEVLVATL
jgi:16S rRNA (adenine1518-N6/adenine1519-N6)-dimethyltransferase